MKTVSFYFDFGSPASYLAATQLRTMAAQTGASLEYRPVLLGAVFRASGNRSPVEVPAKARYMLRDLQRHAARYGVPFQFSPFFPLNTLTLMRVATVVQAREPERMGDFVNQLFAATWAEPKNLGDASVLREAITSAKFDATVILEAAEQQDTKDRLRAETDAAVARGLFGVPTMFVEEEMYFGQDRLDFVSEALRAG
jgi:2-hydroxychromene-2-carboxylate isomerase